MCKWGTHVELELTVPASLSHTGKDYLKMVKIDKCLAPLIKALNECGFKTIQSCCGHGKHEGRIDLADGQVLIIPLWPTQKKEV